jgi:RNA polymerase sigma-70 factor (ECF subfamily)
MAINLKELDFDVIRQAQLGNEESLSYLAEHAKDKLFVYLYRLTLDHNLAEDLTQESIVQMLEAIKRLDIPNKQCFWAWLYRTALGKVQHYFRESGNKSIKHKVTINIDQLKQYADESKNSALQHLIRQEMVEALSEAFAALKLEHRNVLTLRCLDELPYTQIASILGGTELRVRLLFLRAKQSLKRQLTQRGFKKRYLLSSLAAFAALTAKGSKTVSAAQTVSASLTGVSLGTTALGVVTSKYVVAAAFAIVVFSLVIGGSIRRERQITPRVQPAQQQVWPRWQTMRRISWSPGFSAAIQIIRANDPDDNGWWASSTGKPQQPAVQVTSPEIIIYQASGDWQLLILPKNHFVELSFPNAIIDGEGEDVVVMGRISDAVPLVFATDGADQQCLLPESKRHKFSPDGNTSISYDISMANLTFIPQAIRVVGTSNNGLHGGYELGGVNARTH